MKITKNAIEFHVDTVDDLANLSGEDKQVCIVSDEDRGGVFIYNSSKSSDNDGGTVFNGWVRKYEGPVNVKWFGVVGDGINDDTEAIQKALLVSKGKTLVFKKGDTYIVTDELQMQESCKIEAYGAAFNFFVPDNTYCLRLNHSCTVSGGAFRNKGASSGGDGRYHVPITIGSIDGAYGSGKFNCHIENVNVQQLNTEKANIGIFGDSHNITLKNIIIEPSTTSALGILVHWSAENDIQDIGTVSHGYNILIDGVKSKGLKPSTKPSEGGVVFLSGCYNVDVKNIDVEDSYWSVRTQVGIAGNTNSNIAQQKKVLTGIKISNVNSKNVYQPISAIWGGDNAGGNGKYYTNIADITYTNCNSYNDSIPTSVSSSIYIAGLSGIKINKCNSENFYHGLVASTSGGLNGTNYLSIDDVNFKSLGHSGIVIKSDTVGLTHDVHINNATIIDFNKEESSATPEYCSAIYSEAERTSVNNINIKGDQGLYGVYMYTNSEDCICKDVVVSELHTTTNSFCYRSQSITNKYVNIINNTTNAITAVGGSAMIDGGSNANGYYVKLEDGTLIQYGEKTGLDATDDYGTGGLYYNASASNYAFPIPFVGQVPAGSLSMDNLAMFGTLNVVTLTTFRLNYIYTDSVTGRTGRWFAIGRWK
jgi:hypothetical protein